MKDKTNMLKTEHGFEASNPKKTSRTNGTARRTIPHISKFAPKNHDNYLRYKRLKKGLSLRCVVSA